MLMLFYNRNNRAVLYAVFVCCKSVSIFLMLGVCNDERYGHPSSAYMLRSIYTVCMFFGLISSAFFCLLFFVYKTHWSPPLESNHLRSIFAKIIAKTVLASYRQVKLTRFNTFLTHFNASCVLANAHEC